ncbi:hypothetical protein SAMN06265222_103330 [Neorhodopirellula lusitana]|uniref:Uncharacterized protein n=1 Tax=Neorhodopirellula lusitana TaxID=445327 RepID=A0ABY1PX14_9BACT|nr:hypothetical protein SAMN06265222_103330 [Neorhodopirellula lusitana]
MPCGPPCWIVSSGTGSSAASQLNRLGSRFGAGYGFNAISGPIVQTVKTINLISRCDAALVPVAVKASGEMP